MSLRLDTFLHNEFLSYWVEKDYAIEYFDELSIILVESLPFIYISK